MTTKKVELPHFTMGKSYGSNQNWMMDPWMHLGGCAALTTCDAFIDFSLYRNRDDLYHFKDPKKRVMTRQTYSRFAMSVKLYLEPRRTGIKDLETYMEGVRLYLEDTDVTDLYLEGLEGSESYEAARDTIKASIDDEIPVAYLMLKHKDKHSRRICFWPYFCFVSIYFDIRQTQWRKDLSVRIRAKISPSGSARMMSMASVSQ